MDHGYRMDGPYRPIPADLAGPAQRIVSFLGGGGRAVVITGPARAGKRALLDGLLAGMSGRVTRIENRTGLPLAVDGVLKQMGKVAESEGDERGLFFRTLAEQAYDDYSAVIAVEDGHTLTTLALSALARVQGLGGPDRPGMILLLTGEPALLEKLDGPGLEGLRNSRRTLMVALPGPGEVAAQPAVQGIVPSIVPECAEPLTAGDMVGWARGNLGFRGVVIAVLAGAIAAGGGLTWSLVSHSRRLAAVPAQFASQQAVRAEPGNVVVVEPLAPAMPTVPDGLSEPLTPPGNAAAASAPPMGAPPFSAEAGVQNLPEEALRREFDAFLNRAGRDTVKLTPGEREALFREYRQWRARAPAEARVPHTSGREE